MSAERCGAGFQPAQMQPGWLHHNGLSPSGTRAGSGDGQPAAACDRSDLARWSAKGGPMPARLADHIAECAGCAEQVRRVNRVHASLALLGSQPLPTNIHARANGRALRMLRRVTRASAAARHLLHMRPDLPFWQRAQIYVARFSLAAAVAALVFIVKLGVLTGIERTESLGQALASAHWDRHIDPNHEWLERQA